MKNYKKYFIEGKKDDIVLLINRLKDLPPREFGLRRVEDIAMYILFSPTSSYFSDGCFEISDIIDKDNDIKRCRLNIIYDDGIPSNAFDKLTDELFLRYEVKNTLSEIGIYF